MKLRRRTAAGWGLQALVLAAFASRLLIPAGYMPSSVGDGFGIRLCPAGLPDGMLANDGGDHDHGDEGSELLWENCSLGALAATAAITSNYQIQVPYSAESFLLALQPQRSAAATTVRFYSRAPPTSTI